jgi:hypothetical protein
MHTKPVITNTAMPRMMPGMPAAKIDLTSPPLPQRKGHERHDQRLAPAEDIAQFGVEVARNRTGEACVNLSIFSASGIKAMIAIPMNPGPTIRVRNGSCPLRHAEGWGLRPDPPTEG